VKVRAWVPSCFIHWPTEALGDYRSSEMLVDEESTIIFYQVLKKRQLIAVSPYLSFQYGYKNWIPTQSYYAFATQAGCPANAVYTDKNSSIFQCLSQKDTKVLQAASFNVAASGVYGTWGFLPVTDGVFIQQLPSQQLLQKHVNGVNLLSGVNYLSIMFTCQN
jgi:hypothetical protein